MLNIETVDQPAIIRELRYPSGNLGSNIDVGPQHEKLIAEGWEFLDGPKLKNKKWVLSYIKREAS